MERSDMVCRVGEPARTAPAQARAKRRGFRQPFPQAVPGVGEQAPAESCGTAECASSGRRDDDVGIESSGRLPLTVGRKDLPSGPLQAGCAVRFRRGQCDTVIIRWADVRVAVAVAGTSPPGSGRCCSSTARDGSRAPDGSGRWARLPSADRRDAGREACAAQRTLRFRRCRSAGPHGRSQRRRPTGWRGSPRLSEPESELHISVSFLQNSTRRRCNHNMQLIILENTAYVEGIGRDSGILQKPPVIQFRYPEYGSVLCGKPRVFVRAPRFRWRWPPRKSIPDHTTGCTAAAGTSDGRCPSSFRGMRYGHSGNSGSRRCMVIRACNQILNRLSADPDRRDGAVRLCRRPKGWPGSWSPGARNTVSSGRRLVEPWSNG